jgi:hypothetical protein
MAHLLWGPDVLGKGNSFSIEDPAHEYQAVRQALTAERGWARVRKDEACDLRWTYDERAIPFDALRDHQMANHYRDIRCLTTKAGLTRTLDEELPWCASTDAACFFPRSHALDTDRAAFVRDFRRTACCGAVRAFADGLPALKEPLRTCVRVCQAWAAELGEACFPADDLVEARRPSDVRAPSRHRFPRRPTSTTRIGENSSSTPTGPRPDRRGAGPRGRTSRAPRRN